MSIHSVPAFAKGKVPHRYVIRGSSGLSKTLSPLCLFKLACTKLTTKGIKMSHCKRGTITLECGGPLQGTIHIKQI